MLTVTSMRVITVIVVRVCSAPIVTWLAAKTFHGISRIVVRVVNAMSLLSLHVTPST